MHPKDSDVYPKETKVIWKKNGKKAVIKDHTFQMDGKNFLHYLGTVEGRGDDLYCLLHSEIELDKSSDPTKS